MFFAFLHKLTGLREKEFRKDWKCSFNCKTPIDWLAVCYDVIIFIQSERSKFKARSISTNQNVAQIEGVIEDDWDESDICSNEN